MNTRRPAHDKNLDQINRLLAGYPHTFFGASETNIPELEQWFYEPPASAYRIERVPKEPFATCRYDQSADGHVIQHHMIPGGFLPQLFFKREQLQTVLIIEARCALQAIAAAIYVDRIAGVEAGICPGCGVWFEMRNQKTKKYCDNPKCAMKIKQRNYRSKVSKRRAEAGAKTT